MRTVAVVGASLAGLRSVEELRGQGFDDVARGGVLGLCDVLDNCAGILGEKTNQILSG